MINPTGQMCSSEALREAFEEKIRATPFTGEVKWDGEKYTNSWVQGQWEWLPANRPEAKAYAAGHAAATARLMPILEGAREALKMCVLGKPTPAIDYRVVAGALASINCALGDGK